MRYLDNFETFSRKIFLTCHHINKSNCNFLIWALFWAPWFQTCSEVSPIFMTVTGALNNVIDNFSALLLRKRLTALFLPRKPVIGKPSRKQGTISVQGRGVASLKGSCGGKVYLWHPRDWKEDVINIKPGQLNEALHSYYIHTFITRYGLLLAFGWWLTSRTFAFRMFTTFTLIWKEKLVILLSKKFMYFNEGHCKILSSLFGFYIACLFTTTPSSYKN